MSLELPLDDDEPLPEVTPAFERATAHLYMAAHQNKVITPPPGWRFTWSDGAPHILPDDNALEEGEQPVLSFELDQDMFTSPAPKDAPDETLDVNGLVDFSIIGRAARARIMHLIVRPGEGATSIRMRLEVLFTSLQDLLGSMRTPQSMPPHRTHPRRRRHRRLDEERP